MTKNDKVKKEKDILKEIKKINDYKNKILGRLPGILFKKACLCGVVSNEKLVDNNEELEQLCLLSDQSEKRLNCKEYDLTDESYADSSLNRNDVRLKYFLLEEIYDFLAESNSKIFTENDIVILLKKFFEICSKNYNENFLTPEIVLEYKTMNSLKTRFLGSFCADFEDVCIFDVSNVRLYSVKLLKDSIFINPRPDNENWKNIDKYDSIILVNFCYKKIGEEIVPNVDGFGLCPPEERLETIDFSNFEKNICELLSKLKDSKNLFCSFTYMLSHEEKVELKRILTKNDISLKALIKFDNYSYLGAYNDYGEEIDSLIDSQSILLLEKKDKTKGNQDYVLSQINNHIKEKEIKNLVETIKKRKKSSAKQKESNVVVEIISPKVDYVYSFEEIIKKNKPLKAKQQQIVNGLIPHFGKDLIKANGIRNFNQYKDFSDESQSFYIPINPKVFRLTGISSSISEIREKVFNSNLVVGDLAFDKLKWYQHVSNQHKNFCEKEFKKYPLNGSWHNLINNIDIRERNEGGDIISHFLSEVGRFSVNIIENEVVISDEDFKQRIDLNNEIDKYNSIKNQIIQASCVQVTLNKENLLMDFFIFLLECTESGKFFLRKWKDESDNGNKSTPPIEVFQGLKLLLPLLDKQQLILRKLSQIDKEQELLNVLQSDRQKFINWLDGHNRNIIFEISDKKSSLLFDDNSSTYEFLPQPLASILYLDEYEDCENYARKCRNLLLFFEATAQFHATILLSEFSLDKGNEKKIAKIIYNALFTSFGKKMLDGESDSYVEFSFTFGTWTTILSQLILDEKKSNKLYENSLYRELKKAEELFKSKKCLELLMKAKTQRNEEAGHTNNKTIQEDKELYLTLKNLSNQITGCLVQMYGNVQFICINGIKGIDKDKRLFGGIAKGANPRLRYIEIEAPDSSLMRLAKDRCQPYIKNGMGLKVGKDSLLPIVPFIKYVDLLNSEDMLKSTYFASSGGLYLDNSEKRKSWINWKSYDLGRVPRREESYETDNMTKYLLDWIDYWLKTDI